MTLKHLANLEVTILTMRAELFQRVPYGQRLKMHRVLSEIIEKVEGDGDGNAINRIEKSLTRFLVKVWNRRASTAVFSAVKSIGVGSGLFTKRDEAKVFKAIEKAYKTIEKEIGPRLLRDTTKIYSLGQKKFVKDFKGDLEKSIQKRNARKAGEETAIALGFEIGTEEFVAHMASLEKTSIGTHFSRTLRPQISKTISEAVFEKGLNKKQAGIFLQKELTRKLGGDAFRQSVPASIRLQGKKAISAYHEGLSATNVTLTRAGANIQSMQQAEVQQIQFVAVIDNRTSQICASMDGRIFTLEQTGNFMKGVMDAKDADELKEFAPWRKDLSEFGVKAGQKLNDKAVQADLAKAGVIVPPLHFRCRSELHPA